MACPSTGLSVAILYIPQTVSEVGNYKIMYMGSQINGYKTFQYFVFFIIITVGGDTESVESSELEETDENSPVQVEHDIDKMSNVSARVVLLVSFNVNSFDYLSVKGNLDPVAKYLKVKTRGMGKYEMAVPIAKELLRKGYVVPKGPTQMLNYNRIKKHEIKSEKDISFLFVKGNKASSTVKQSSTCVPTVQVSECKISVPSSQSKSALSIDDGQSDGSEELSETEQVFRMS